MFARRNVIWLRYYVNLDESCKLEPQFASNKHEAGLPHGSQTQG